MTIERREELQRGTSTPDAVLHDVSVGSADHAEADLAETLLDITAMHEHTLSDGSLVQMSIAMYTILCSIKEKAVTKDGWLHPEKHSTGIMKKLGSLLGHKSETQNTTIARISVASATEQELVEVKCVDAKVNVKTINARITEKGLVVLDELAPHYPYEIESSDTPKRREVVSRMLYDILHMYELLGRSSLPTRVIELQEKQGNLGPDTLAATIAELTRIQNTLTDEVDSVARMKQVADKVAREKLAAKRRDLGI